MAELVVIMAQNLTVLKTGRAKAIRFSTLELCEVLECEPGDLLAYKHSSPQRSSPLAGDPDFVPFSTLRVMTEADSSPFDFAQGAE